MSNKNVRIKIALCSAALMVCGFAYCSEQERLDGDLLSSVVRGSQGRATLLIDKKANVNMLSSEGKLTPLMAASMTGDSAMVELLLEARADIHLKGGVMKMTALHLAASNRHGGVVRSLLAARANCGDEDTCGDTPLLSVVDPDNNDPLKNTVQIMQVLLDAKADINHKNHSGETALAKAAHWGHFSAVQLLLALRADHSSRDKHGCSSLLKALMPLTASGKLSREKTALLLLDAKADMSYQFDNGSRALALAFLSRYDAVIEYLLAFGGYSDEELDKNMANHTSYQVRAARAAMHNYTPLSSSVIDIIAHYCLMFLSKE